MCMVVLDEMFFLMFLSLFARSERRYVRRFVCSQLPVSKLTRWKQFFLKEWDWRIFGALANSYCSLNNLVLGVKVYSSHSPGPIKTSFITPAPHLAILGDPDSFLYIDREIYSLLLQEWPSIEKLLQVFLKKSEYFFCRVCALLPARRVWVMGQLGWTRCTSS